ncbi:hypothetical protein BO71DRAFT_236358 [Aspergillus ellipticus CBS 707.79]|uniref:Uncharacterized protein n=1 Tax=Aspergillus ellipticus CBS 707.79 TaxID=1448320 RepID=A0A319E6H6_9EURO|nr:hypothetical protein BO71DRAFT_236358 [Aspergillus ellipticus CBS 707.79]
MNLFPQSLFLKSLFLKSLNLFPQRPSLKNMNLFLQSLFLKSLFLKSLNLFPQRPSLKNMNLFPQSLFLKSLSLFPQRPNLGLKSPLLKGNSSSGPFPKPPLIPKAGLALLHLLAIPNHEIPPKAPDQTQPQGHIASISCADLVLYGNWESLSPKYKKKKAKKLASGGLPVPNEGGFISIVAI